MTRSKIALVVLVAMIFSIIPFSVFATETDVVAEVDPTVAAIEEFTSEDGPVVLNKDVRANGCDGAIYAHDGANVTIEGGNIHGVVCKGEACDGKYLGYAMAVYANASTVTIKGGTFTNDLDPNDPTQADLIYVKNGATINIEGGVFKCSTPKWTLNAKDPSDGQVVVTGGKFFEFNPADTKVSAAGCCDVIVPEGYTVVPVPSEEGLWYEVQKLNDPIIVDGTEKTIAGDLKANGCDGAIFAKNGANVTINSGNIHGQVCPDDGYAMAVYANASTVTINGGTFTNDLDPNCLEQADLIYVKAGAKIYIKGGTFKCSTPKWTLNAKDPSDGQVIVTGGRFYQFDPSNTKVSAAGSCDVVVPEGYTVVGPDSQGYYEVVCAHDKSNFEKQSAKSATYVEEGNEAYYVCKGNNCGKWFKDAEGKEEITDKSSIVIPKLIEVNDKKDEVVVKNEAVDNAVADAKANNTDVVIPLGNIGTTVSSVALPVEKLEVVAGTDKALVVETTEAVVTIDNKALEEVVKQAGAEPTITLEVKKVEEKVLSETQQEVIENKEVAFVFTAEMLANGKEISNFNGGKVKLAIPFTPAENTNASDYKVFYIADDGSISEVLTQYVDGKIVVELEHFSEYALINVNKVANQGGTGSAAPAPATKDNTPKTGATSVVVAMMAIAGAGYMLTRKEER